MAADRHVPAESIVVNSDHSHSGPDLIGLWGGVPVRYLQYVRDQTIRALEEALDTALNPPTQAEPTPAAASAPSEAAEPARAAQGSAG